MDGIANLLSIRRPAETASSMASSSVPHGALGLEGLISAWIAPHGCSFGGRIGKPIEAHHAQLANPQISSYGIYLVGHVKGMID